MALVFVGQGLELPARERTGDAIHKLLDLAPKTARRVFPDGSEHDVRLAQIMVGHAPRMRPGEAVPVNGTVLEGHSTLTEGMLTGEAITVQRARAIPSQVRH